MKQPRRKFLALALAFCLSINAFAGTSGFASLHVKDSTKEHSLTLDAESLTVEVGKTKDITAKITLKSDDAFDSNVKDGTLEATVDVADAVENPEVKNQADGEYTISIKGKTITAEPAKLNVTLKDFNGTKLASKEIPLTVQSNLDDINAFPLYFTENHFSNPYFDLVMTQETKARLTTYVAGKETNIVITAVSDEAVVKIEENGCVLAAQKLPEGKDEARTLITVKDESGRTYSYRVAVAKLGPDKKIKLSIEGSYGFGNDGFVGDEFKAEAYVRDKYETPAEIKSLNPEIAEYDSATGKITAKAVGTAYFEASLAGTETVKVPLRILPAEFKNCANLEYSTDGTTFAQAEGALMTCQGSSIVYRLKQSSLPAADTLYFKVKPGVAADQFYFYGDSFAEQSEDGSNHVRKEYTKTLEASKNSDGTYTVSVPTYLLKIGEFYLKMRPANTKDAVTQSWNFNFFSSGEEGGAYQKVEENYPEGTYTAKETGNKLTIDKSGNVSFNDAAIIDGAYAYDASKAFEYTQNLSYGFHLNSKNIAELSGLNLSTPYADATERWLHFELREFKGNLSYDSAKDEFTQILLNEDDEAEGEIIFKKNSSSGGDKPSGGGSGSSSSDSDSSTSKPSTPSTGSGTTANGNTITPETKPGTVTGGQATTEATVNADTVLNAAKDATASNPYQMTVNVPASDTAQLLAKPDVKVAAVNVVIPSSVTSSGKVVVAEVKLDPSILSAAKATGKEVSVAVKDETGKQIYSITVSGSAMQGGIAPNANMNFAASVAKTAQGTELEMKQSGLVPGGAAKIALPGFTAGSTQYVYAVDQATGAYVEVTATTTDAAGNVSFNIPEGGKFVVMGSPAQNAFPVKGDTKLPAGVAKGGTYTFKFTVANGQAPAFSTGNASVFSGKVVKKGNDYYYAVTANGGSGDATGIYCAIPGGKPVKVGIAAVK